MPFQIFHIQKTKSKLYVLLLLKFNNVINKTERGLFIIHFAANRNSHSIVQLEETNYV